MSIGTIVPFPASELADYRVDRTLDSAVKKIAFDNHFDKLGIGLIDLTLPIPSSGAPYGGANDDAPFPVGSLCKVAAMYAGYQLRRAVANALIGVVPDPKDNGSLIIALASQQLQSLSTSPNWDRFPHDFPNLSEILSVTLAADGASWTTDFRMTGENWRTLRAMDPDLKDLVSLKAAQTLGFWQQMEMMIGMSDNCASMACIQELGFQYINGLLAKSGLFEDNKGIWLGAPYARACIGSPRNWQACPSGGGFQVGTARAFAKFMGSLQQFKLVSANDSLEMLNLMNKSAPPGNATRSFFKDGLDKVLPGELQDSSYAVVSKLGIGDFRSDAAIVQHKISGGGLICYAAAGLGAPNSASGDAQLAALIVQLDALVTRSHTPAPTVTPTTGPMPSAQ